LESVETPKSPPGLPDWEKVATELATHQHLTLQLLWLEYKEQNPEGLSESEIWHLYMTLTRVEEAFRALKSDLGLRPVYHQLARRTSAHLFISVLAYHLYGAIAYELSTKGDTRRPSTILERLTTHMRAIATLTDDKRKVHHIRISTTPDPEQRKIFESLGILTPYRGELR
jgi:transposase